MFRQEIRDSHLGETLNDQRDTRRRSVFLESASGFYPPNPKTTNITKVAPAPIQYFNEIAKHDLKSPPNGVIYNLLKPVYTLMRAMGIFPVANLNPGAFRVTPQWLGYSVGVFICVLSYLAYSKWASLVNTSNNRDSLESRFEEAVINYLFTVYTLPIIINPIVWYEAKLLATVLQDWVYFERIYNKVTKKKMSIFLGNKPLIITIMLPIVSCATMVVTHITMNHKVLDVVPYCYINTVTYLIGGFWFIQCDVVGKVATLIADDFQSALKHIGPSSQVADYRSLWMLLSKLIRDVGNASGYTVTFLCLYLFLIVTLTIYGLLSQLQEGLSFKDLGLTITAIFAVVLLFFICDEAHYASNCVRVQFQKNLLLVELNWMNEEVQQEINMFLRATEMSPTDMSLAGFFDVNRNLFKSLLATMVTYLVVLLQFQISLPDENSMATNATKMVLVPTLAPK